jgi:polyphosphate kinase
MTPTTSALATDRPPLKLLGREQAILEFNRRVMAQAQREDVPLLERLRYICIVSSNLDEFFEVRYADVIEASRTPGTGINAAYIAEVSRESHRLVEEQYRIFNEVVTPKLHDAGILILNHADRSATQREWVADFFRRQVRPLLVPIGLDPAHPFPQVANKTLNFIVRLGGMDAFGRDNDIAIVRIPRVLPRVIALPASLMPEGQQGFVLLSSVIRAHLDELFPGREIKAFSQFRLTRDSDIEVDEDDVTDLRQALRSKMSTRQFGQSVRLEVVRSCPSDLCDFLLEQFSLPPQALFMVNGPVNLVRLTQLIDQADADPLRFPSYEPAWPADLPAQGLFEHVRHHDCLLHHPFQSFDVVVQFLREAVYDPDVLAIKQTIYRTGSESVLMELLLEAVRRGKEVLAVVELKARFDEEANINWAERLEALGAQVVYGIVGLKTHAKMMLITRREGSRLRRYAHLSTGNYNPKTSRLYTDVGFLTSQPDMTADVDRVFQQLSSLTQMKSTRLLQLAPFSLQDQMLRLIARCGDSACAGRPARIVVKCNALTDEPLVNALIDAGQAGVDIDLIVRGACILPPGLEGLTDRIRVRSVVGRMLEHTRVLYFRWGSEEHDEALYLSSADWMNRNMTRRIEAAWPVRDAALRQRVIDECLVPYLLDGRDAWRQLSDGRYERIQLPGGHSAQRALMALHRGNA